MKRSMVMAACTLALAACDDGATEGDVLTCADLEVAACGGDLVGGWTSVLVCNAADDFSSLLPPECADTRTIMPTVTATATFAADGTYDVTSTAVGRMSIALSSPCLVALSEQMWTAEAMCAELGYALQNEDPPVTCSFANEVCTCAGDVRDEDAEVGTYVASGTMVTMTPTGDVPYSFEYCVDGDDLTMLEDESRTRFVRL